MTDNETLPEGTNADELFTDQNIRDVIIPYKGKNWKFTVRELTWKQKSACVTAGTKVNIVGKKANAKKVITMDMQAYNEFYLTKAIVKAPFPVTPASFMKLDDKFGDLLVDAIIKDDEGDDEGESDGLLEA